MKVIIFGGLGFVGRHFAKRLLDDGHTVAIIDNMYSGVELYDWMFRPNGWDEKTRSVPNLQLMIGDCRSFFATAVPGSLWSSNQFDLIIHCAAIVGGRVKIEDDPLEIATDLAIDSEFFRWVTKAKPYPKVIYFSSSAVYPLELQTKESHRILVETDINFDANYWYKPDQTYGFTKFAGEYLAKFAREKYGLDVAIYRPFGGYGEDQAPTYPFPAILKRVVQGDNPVFVWGSGDQERDWIHVDDIVECVLQTYDKLGGKALNLGTGIPISFFKLAEMACAQHPDDNQAIRNDPLKPEGVFSRVADAAQMLKLYTPKISLAEGIQRALKTALDTRRGKM